MSFISPATPRGRAQRQAAIRRSIPDTHTFAVLAQSLRDNILRTYDAASPEHVLQGSLWYQDAYYTAVRLRITPANEHNGGAAVLTMGQVVGIMAALSPSTNWDRNIALAEDMILAGDCRHAYGDAIRKARAIRDLPPSPSTKDVLAILGGRKVRSFFHAIYYYDRPSYSHVVVDRHAHAIALGVDRPLADYAAKALDAPGRYLLLAAAYRAAARARNVSPAAMQATTWLHFRDNHNGRRTSPALPPTLPATATSPDF